MYIIAAISLAITTLTPQYHDSGSGSVLRCPCPGSRVQGGGSLHLLLSSTHVSPLFPPTYAHTPDLVRVRHAERPGGVRHDE